MPLINYIGNRQEALDNRDRGNAPTPPALSLDYIVVGGGSATYLIGVGGSGGGVVSGSAVTMSFRTSFDVTVGLGGDDTASSTGQSSSISGSSFGFFGAGGASANGSGLPQGNPTGLTGAGGTEGGGGGSSLAGRDGVLGQNGAGGSGSIWVNNTYYAGGGGGTGGTPAGGPGAAGIGGGGYNSESGVNGLGGGAGGEGTNGGSGVVIVRYLTSSVSPPYDNTISGGTLLISGGYAYHTFTGSGQFNYSF